MRLASDVARLCAQLGEADAARLIGAEAAAAPAGAAVVVVVGEKKRGKTSLINALVGRPGLLPVDADIATNVHVTVGYADSEWARVIDDAGPAGREIPLADIAQYAALDPETGRPLRENVRHVDVGLPVPLLAEGLELVDTPGVGGLVAGHRMKTMATLSRADALMFVLSGATELTKSECDFLAAATERISTVLFVVTQVDKYPEWRQVVQASQDLVREHAPRFGGAPWFPVSNRYLNDSLRAERAGATARAEQLRADSGFGPLLDALRTRVAGRAQEIRLANLVHLTRPPLDRMIAAAQQRGKSLRRDPGLAEAIDADRAELATLSSGEAQWRRTLARRFTALEAELRTETTRLLNDLNATASNQIAQGGPDVLAVVKRNIDNGFEGIWLDLANHLAVGTAGVLAEVSADFDVRGIDVFGAVDYPDRLRNPRPLDLSRPPEQNGLIAGLERGIVRYRNAVYIGAVASIIFTPVIGTWVGSISAALIASKQRAREQEQRSRADAQRYAQLMLQEARTEIPPVLSAAARDTSARLEDHLLAQIAARREQLTAALAEHQRLLKASDAELARETEKLKAALARLRAASASADELLTRLDRAAE
jgi:hypothetical protein